MFSIAVGRKQPRERSCSGEQVAEGAAPQELEQRPLTRALLQPTAAYVLVAGARALEAACKDGPCKSLQTLPTKLACLAGRGRAQVATDTGAFGTP